MRSFRFATIELPTARTANRAGFSGLQLLLGLREGHRCVDVSKVGQTLRKVAQQGAGPRIDLLGEQPQVVGPAERPVEHRARVIEAALPGQALGQPEGAAEKRTLAALEPVAAAVPIEQAI